MKSPVDKLMDLVLSMVARLKEERYSLFTFDNLLELATDLKNECPAKVAGYKCYVVTEEGSECHRIGVFPVDESHNTFGGEDVVMRVIRADALDEKIRSLMLNDHEGSFFVPEK